MSKTSKATIAMLLVLIFSGSTGAKYGGGTGTPGRPYLINNSSQMKQIGLDPSDWDKHFKLMVDLDLAGVAMTPIGNFTTPFRGTFDGNGCTISNLTIHLPTTILIGLFGVVDNPLDSYTIFNLGLIESYITGNTPVGVLAGELKNGTISHCYASGTISAIEYVGGLVGSNHGGTISNSFWDTQTSGQAASAGGTGKTTAQMQTIASFIDAGWDFLGEASNGTEDIWWMCEDGFEYPRLTWEVPYIDLDYGGGSGSIADPYLLSDPCHLQTLSVATCHWNNHFKLSTDLDLTGVAMTPIGTNAIPFSGTFDGNGFTLANLTINLPTYDHVGLFGYVDNPLDPKTILNLGLINPVITADNYVGALAGRLINATLTGCYAEGGSVNGVTYVGGLVGYNWSSGTISACYTTGQVNGTSSVGGLMGYCRYDTIRRCYATGTITGTGSIAGGLVGNNSIAGATISNCYATGAVEGTRYVGGLVGWKNGAVSNCYAAGAVKGDIDVGGLVGWNNGPASNSFWDTQTSGQPTSTGGTGKTTAQMQTITTFTGAGWDCIGESANGTDDIWQLCIDGLDYPRLVWQFGPADFIYPGLVDINDLFILINDWLTENSRCCDIFPAQTPDGIVNILDFAEYSRH